MDDSIPQPLIVLIDFGISGNTSMNYSKHLISMGSVCPVQLKGYFTFRKQLVLLNFQCMW